MPKKLDPLISEFQTQEQADAYDRWFREKVQEAIDNPGKSIPHEEVMAHVEEVIRAAVEKRAASTARSGFAEDGVKKLDPLISEFETEEDAIAYDEWFRQTVQESMDDPGPYKSHEEVMAETDEIIAKAARRKKQA